MDHVYIKDYVSKLVKKYGTSDPFSLADILNIVVFNVPLGDLQGCYFYMKKHRVIYINSDIGNTEIKRVVMAHEIGHALLHTKINCYFMRANTLMNTTKYELEANRFAAELLIPDNVILENPGCSASQLAMITRTIPYLVKYKLFST